MRLMGCPFLLCQCFPYRRLSCQFRDSPPKIGLWRMHPCFVIAKRLFPIFSQKQRPIQIDHLGALSHQYSRGHGKRRANHTSDHDTKSRSLRLVTQSQRLGQAACLIELYLDQIVLAAKRRQRRAIMSPTERTSWLCDAEKRLPPGGAPRCAHACAWYNPC